ncbi:NAD(P)-dependent oxidoreductase [Actinopolymorpha sp. B17G11]|uniref:NAD(P)-dependent oxidoreductase n=1 Tax=Actinopolymorpha sp. B17G11 TaxID=3160861 RepID=UPI0032E3D148
MAVVLSTHPLHARAAGVIEDVAELRTAPETTAAALTEQARDVDVVIVRAPLPPVLFDQAYRLRAAIRHGAGVDMIPLDAATNAGVLVANVPGANARSVAEYVIFAALALRRRFRTIDADLRTAGWVAGRQHAEHAAELHGGVLGVIGTGNVGTALADIASAGFGMTVVGYDPRPSAAPAAIGYVDLQELARVADVVVCCCPLTEETTHLVDATFLAYMKPDGLLVNVARGPVVDESALLSALRAGRLGGAALDVFETQPLPADHPFLDLDNVLLTPHLAGITDASMERMGLGAAQEALRVLAGELPRNLVNPEAVPRYRVREQAWRSST